jgi:hypothetical protein
MDLKKHHANTIASFNFLTVFFRLIIRNEIPRVFLFFEMVRNRILSIFIFRAMIRNGIPSTFIFRGKVWNKIMKFCFSLLYLLCNIDEKKCLSNGNEGSADRLC